MITDDIFTLYNHPVYYALVCSVVLLLAGMCYVTQRLRHRQRRFIAAVWIVFLFFLTSGSLLIISSIHSQRQLWREYFCKTTRSYADIVQRCNNWKIRPGHKDFFSKWSQPVLLSETAVTTPLVTTPLQGDTAALQQTDIHKRLDTPADLTVTLKNSRTEFDFSQRPMEQLNRWAVNAATGFNTSYNAAKKSIFVQWSSVPNAATYQLQWSGEPETPDGWLKVYSGSKTSCMLNIPDMPNGRLALRVRAEDGTPADDPVYMNLLGMCEFPVAANQYIAYAYTLRRNDDGSFYFVVSPPSDANHNGKIDTNERQADLGEIYPPSALFNYVAAQKKEAMAYIQDAWGRFFTVAEPIYAPDGSFDGIFAFDFHPNIVHKQLLRNHIFAYFFFVSVGIIYFAGILFVAETQKFSEEQQCLAKKLEVYVLELQAAKKVTEEASRVKTSFLTNMSHELRTPLNGILGFTEIFGRKLLMRCLPEEKPECETAIDNIKDSGKHLLSIIQDVLQIAALDEGAKLKLTFVPIHLPDLINELGSEMRSSAENKNVRLIITDHGTTPHWIWNDPAHIRQVLIHLIGNAVKFTPKGSIEIGYGTAYGDVNTIPARQDGINDALNRKMMFISVKDTGIGIAPELLNTIFQPFVQADSTLTRHFGGTGIGLSVAKQVANMLDGDIKVESRVGKGSTFTFMFPAQIVQCTDCPRLTLLTPQASSKIVTKKESSGDAPQNAPKNVTEFPHPAAPSPQTTPPNPAYPLENRHILIVDDSKINQMVLSAALREAGCRITLAKDGLEGVTKTVESISGGNPLDIILMDMQMPVMDGYEATRTLRSHNYTKPIIAVTAHALPGDKEKCLEAGCDGYLSKPVEPQLLKDTIEAFFVTK
ncbi:MAG: response regulator [Planctomycetaceae bacterium]|jgi:signal transduction histidine kinase/ActR/RegA family two-component response regulator|nr:response regulator [Planctomycetaceae bacterium]